MSVVGPAAGGGPGNIPRAAVQNIQRIQQRIIVLNTQYSHVLGQFNMALQRLQTHIAAARPLQAGPAWDAKGAQLAAAVDRLALEIETLTDKLDDLVDQLADSRERLGIIFGGTAAPVASNPVAQPAAGTSPGTPLHDTARA